MCVRERERDIIVESSFEVLWPRAFLGTRPLSSTAVKLNDHGSMSALRYTPDLHNELIACFFFTNLRNQCARSTRNKEKKRHGLLDTTFCEKNLYFLMVVISALPPGIRNWPVVQCGGRLCPSPQLHFYLAASSGGSRI